MTGSKPLQIMHGPKLDVSRGYCTARANTIVNESVLVTQHRNKHRSASPFDVADIQKLMQSYYCS